ncbi:MAG: hypothetical protein NT062_08595 [Proteobacteria bacterium]|nr:hypothetical protein [Pseudomonadota bacterium]
MAYRGDEAGDLIEAPTAEGNLRVEIGPRTIQLEVGDRRLHVGDGQVTVIDQKYDRKTSFAIGARLFTARDVPREDLGIWLEIPDDQGVGMRRIFGVAPVSLLTEAGLPALAALDRLAARLRVALADHARDVVRAVELGRGYDKVLLVDHGDRHVVYARRAFRDRARLALTVYTDGRILVPEGKGKGKKEIAIRSRFGVRVWGDHLRFADPHGVDLAHISLPWIAPEDRAELARRIGQLVDRSPG